MNVCRDLKIIVGFNSTLNGKMGMIVECVKCLCARARACSSLLCFKRAQRDNRDWPDTDKAHCRHKVLYYT